MITIKIKHRKKYNNHSTTKNGKKFDSKLEAQYGDFLEKSKKLGKVRFYLRQVPFDLPGNVKYRLDFMVFYEKNDHCEVEYVDVKGMKTQVYIMKKKQVEELYPLEITEINKEGVKKALKSLDSLNI